MSNVPIRSMAEHTLTDFLQHSGRVLADVGRGSIVLHRRDGDDLVVMTRGQSDALSTAVRVLAAAAPRPSGAAADEAAAAVLPWLVFLSAEDRAACLRELGEVAGAAVATGHLDRLEELLYQWEASALAAWDDLRLRERTDYDEYVRDEPVPLARP
jgi:hypothetical protein